MKKKIIIFVSIILVVGIITSITCLILFNNKTKPANKNNEETKKTIALEKVDKGVYVYNINKSNDEYIYETIIDNNSIYTVEKNENKNTVYKKDIYTNEYTKVNDINLNDNKYCYIENKYIVCDTLNKKEVFTANLDIIYSGEPKKIIPYKNSYIETNNEKIIFDNNEYAKVNKNFKNYNVYNYSTFSNNAFIYYGNFEGENCLFNFNEKKCEEFDFFTVKEYQDGLFYTEKDKLHTINTVTNERKEYTLPVKDPLSEESQVYKENFIYFKDDYIRIYDLNNPGKVKLLDTRINLNIFTLKIVNDLLYIINENTIYVIDLNDIETKELTSEEITTLLDERLNTKLANIENEYGITIKVKKSADVKFDFWSQEIVGEKRYDAINDSLDTLETSLKSFNKDIFKEFIHGEYTGFQIYIASTIESPNPIDGEEFKYYDKYTIIAQTSGFERTFYHELLHALEDAVTTKHQDIFKNWNSYNPKGFKYGSFDYYKIYSAQRYTIDFGSEDVYFIDNYSQTDEMEDRARIFENLAVKNTEKITKYPNILKKAKYEMEELIKYYPSLSESPVFEAIK